MMTADLDVAERNVPDETPPGSELTVSAVLPDPVHRQKVEAMAGYGIPEADIARVLEIDPDLLRDLYAKELEGGHVKANARVAESLYRKALGEGREAVTAAIFWLKTRAGWKETAVHEVSGKDGAPIAMIEQNPRHLARAILFALELGNRQTELERQAMSAAPERPPLPLGEGTRGSHSRHLLAEDPPWLQGSSAHEITGKDKQPLTIVISAEDARLL